MNKNIYYSGMICLAITLTAIIFKIMHWPGANILILAGIGSLSLIFLPLAYSKSIKSTEDKLLRFLYTAAFISFVIDFIGMVFKIMHWPFTGLIMIVGIPLPFILFLPAYVVYHNKRKLKTDLNFFAVLMFMIYLGIFSALLSLDARYGNYMAYAHSTNNVSKSNTYLAQLNSVNNQTEIAKSAKNLANQIDAIKLNLIRTINPDNKKIIRKDGTIDYFEIENKNLIISQDIVYKAGLDKFIIEFEKFKKQTIVPEPNISRLINEINEYLVPKQKNEKPVIVQLPFITLMNVMTNWQNKLLLISYMQSLRST